MATTREVALRCARKVFQTRGNHSEVHLKEAELVALLQIAAELTLQLGATPMEVAQCEKEE